MNIIRKLFKTKSPKPKKRVLYAITKGTYLGICVVFIKPTEYPKNSAFAAISFGGKDMDGGIEPMEIPEKDVTEGLKNGILDKIGKIPKELYSLCCDEYEKRITMKQKEKEEKEESVTNESTD